MHSLGRQNWFFKRLLDVTTDIFKIKISKGLCDRKFCRVLPDCEKLHLLDRKIWFFKRLLNVTTGILKMKPSKAFYSFKFYRDYMSKTIALT